MYYTESIKVVDSNYIGFRKLFSSAVITVRVTYIASNVLL